MTARWARTLPAGLRWTGVLSVVYVLAFVLAPGSWLQLPVTFVFLTTCPGLLLIDWIDLTDLVVGVMMVVASSIAANTLVTVLLAGTGTYSPLSALVATVSTVLALAYISLGKKRSKLPIELPIGT